MIEECVIVCRGLVGVLYSMQDPAAPMDQYLKAYDPEYADGRGEALWTSNIEEAMVFVDSHAAHECWTTVPAKRPTREDGRPNRPLTAFSILVAPLSDYKH